MIDQPRDPDARAREHVRALADQLRATSSLFGAPLPSRPVLEPRETPRPPREEPRPAPTEPLLPARSIGDVMAEMDATVRAEIATDRERAAREAEEAQRNADYAPIEERERRIASSRMYELHREALEEIMSGVRSDVDEARDENDRDRVARVHEYLQEVDQYFADMAEGE